MVIPLNVLWLAVLISVLAVFCTAPLMSVQTFWILILLFIIAGLALTFVSLMNQRRRRQEPVAVETRVLEYLRAHGIAGSPSEIAESLGIAEEGVAEAILRLEAKGDIPAGSSRVLGIRPRGG
jgi:hypothetical protein